MKDKFIVFSGDLIHGGGINNSNKIRMSLDVRFILTKYLSKNIIQGSANKKYFEKITLN